MLPYAAPHTVQRSPRYLVLEKAKKELSLRNNVTPTSSPNNQTFESLDPGYVKLYSYFEPELQGGDYQISAHQKIATGDGEQHLDEQVTTQEFSVVAPQFQLPQNAILSVYPPQGQAVTAETLPHIVFNDPHLPWTREVIESKEGDRNRVPWLALILFTADELSLTSDELNGPDSLFNECKNLDFGYDDTTKTLKPTTTQSIRLSESDIEVVTEVANACKKNDDNDVTDPSYDTVFIKKSLFKELFRTYQDGNPVQDQDMVSPDVSRYQFLSHVRNANTEGTAESGGGMGMGVFSVTVSHRTGPLDSEKPAPVIAHLVSLEGIPGMKWPIPDSSKYVVLPTLHSWVYTSLPSGSLTIADRMNRLGSSMDLLRPPKKILETPAGNDFPPSKRIYERLKDGYTIVRHRVQTGEVTAAMVRGPLVPTTSNKMPRKMNQLSNSGTDLQVLDQTLGLMDITYSSAWQLGKALAMTDATFCAALNRLRTVVQRLSMNRAKSHLIPTPGLEKTVQSVPQAIDHLLALSNIDPSGVPENMLARWNTIAKGTIDLSLQNNELAERFSKETKKAMTELAAPVDDTGDDAIFNELNQPTSTDWMTVLAWIMDRKFLAGIPAHYLIIDPSFLPPESLRFFEIDQSWMDAMIDGALSIGNHLESHDDKIRAAIKRAVNKYCTTPISQLNRVPQIPAFGFFMRSDIVTQFPDLRVDAVFDPPLDPTCVPILRHENIADGVMLCLFDRVPGNGDQGGLKAVHFTQPPHQQSFSIGSHLDKKKLVPTYRRIYCQYDGSSNRAHPLVDSSLEIRYNPNIPRAEEETPPLSGEAPIFAWGENDEIRTLLFPSYPNHVLAKLQANMPKMPDGSPTFTDNAATAAMVGIELNDSCYELIVSLDQSTVITPQPHLLNMMEAWSAPTVANMMAPPLTELEPDLPASYLPALEDRPALDVSGDNLAPNYRSVYEANEDTHNAVITDLGNLTTDAINLNKPDFRYNIYPIASESSEIGTPQNIKVTSNNGYPQDLVFSIVLHRNDLQSTLHLQEIRFMIEMGPENDSRKVFLMNAYNGPAPTMLSNLRFNVIVERMKRALLIRVVPRTTNKQGVKWSLVNEASFILSMVEVNNYTQNQIAFVKYAEKYDQIGWFRRWLPVEIIPSEQR